MVNDLLHLIFPPLCHICSSAVKRHHITICHTCSSKLPLVDVNHPYFEKWQQRFAARLPLNWFYPLLEYSKFDETGMILNSLKYGDNPKIGEYFGELMGERIKKQGLVLPEVILPVPLHKAKERRRGYNQSWHIAKGIARSLDVALEDKALIKVKNNSSQTKKNRWERMKNVEGSFSVKRDLEHSHLLLVDDVVTTGATIEQCAHTLGNQFKFSVASLGIA